MASASCLCIRCVGTYKRSPVSFPLPDTRRCSTCPTLSHTNRVGVHTSLLSQKPFLSSNFGTRSDDPSPNASLHQRVFLYRKEHLVTVVRTVGAMDGNPSFSVTPAAASLRTAGAGFWALRVATLRVSNCEQMFADSGVILCVHSVGFGNEDGHCLLSRCLVAAFKPRRFRILKATISDQELCKSAHPFW